MGPHRQQPTRLPRPWDSPGKNTGVSCHFLLQCMKVKSESEVVQLCLTLSDPMDYSPPGPPSMGFSRQEYWSGVPLPSLRERTRAWNFASYINRIDWILTSIVRGILNGQIFFLLKNQWIVWLPRRRKEMTVATILEQQYWGSSQDMEEEKSQDNVRLRNSDPS